MIVLEKGKVPVVSPLPGSVPGSTTSANFKLRELHLFTVLETELGITVTWDRGTRLYITLDPKFKGQSVSCIFVFLQKQIATTKGLAKLLQIFIRLQRITFKDCDRHFWKFLITTVTGSKRLTNLANFECYQVELVVYVGTLMAIETTIS